MRRVLKGLGWLGGTLLVLLLAWVACNGSWADARPQPTPAELRLPPPPAAPEHNAFVDLQGLTAPEGEDINAAGQLELRGDGRPERERLHWPRDEVWQCQPSRQDCVKLWRAQPDKVRALLETVAPLGARCDRIAQAERIEEVLPERPASGPLAQVSFAALPIPRFAELSNCVRWFHLKAVAAGQPRQGLTQLRLADRLARQALQGARSLIGTMVGVAVVQRNWLVAGDLAANGAMDPAELTALLAPLPASTLSPRVWAAHEARFARELTRDMVDDVRGCHRVADAGDEFIASWLDRQLCRFKLGLLPEQSAQDIDARWLARLATVPVEGPASCDALEAPPWREPASAYPHWRNTLARWMIDVPGDQWSRYAARQLDLELLRQTLSAQVLGQSIPGAVKLTREAGAQQFAACSARLLPGERDVILRLPLL